MLESLPGAREAALMFEPAQAYWLLSSFCTIHQRTIDPDAVARECTQPMPLAQLARIADKLGMDVEALVVEPSGLASLQPP